MLTARDMWAAIDAAARRQGLTPSGLARLAGLDPTAFNPSKRKDRWPSTETVARILDAIGETWDQFIYFDEETTELPTEEHEHMESITVDGIEFRRKQVRKGIAYWQTEPTILGGSVTEYAADAGIRNPYSVGHQSFKTLEEACSVSISRQRANIQRMRAEVEMYDRATEHLVPIRPRELKNQLTPK